MAGFIHDLRYAARALRRSPSFTAVAVLTLGLGIGANTAVYSFLDNFLLRPLPYPEPDRIVRVLESTPDGRTGGVSTPAFLDWQTQSTSFEFLAGQTIRNMTLSGAEQPSLVRCAWVSPSYFDILGIPPFLGRTFLPEEAQSGRDHVVVVSHILWENVLGADRHIVGQTIRLDGEPYTVVGVMPAQTVFDRSFAQIWKPLAFEPANMNRDFRWFGVFGRLKPGVPLSQAQAEMNAIAARIAQQYPDTNKGWGVAVDRFSDILVGRDARTALYILMAAAGMVLLTACVNLANLALARGAVREREVAVRASLGAGQWVLMRQFLVESLLLSLGGGVTGVALGYVTMKWLASQIPPNSFPAEITVQLDGRVLLFALILSVFTSLLFGLAPALQAARLDLAGSMKDGGRGSSAGSANRRMRNVLVVAEVALAFVLLVGSGLLIRSFFGLLNVAPGFDATNVLTLRLPASAKQYPNPADLNTYLRQVQTAIESVPGVREASMTSSLPLQGWAYGMSFAIAGRPATDRSQRPICFYKMVSPSYFRAVGIHLRSGRLLNDRDTKGAPAVLVINQTMAKRYFPNEDPVGKRLLIPEAKPGKTELGPDAAWEVVGVIDDEKINALNDEQSAGVYVSNEQSPVYSPSLAVRADLNPRILERAVRQAIASVNREQAISDVRTLEEIKAESMVVNRLETVLLSAFAAVALLLAAVGIYGVISYSVAQRTGEIGIRAALGATATNLQALILGDGMLLASIGLLIGTAGSLAVTRLMASMLFGVGARDPLTMASVALVLAAVALLACVIPARRAAKVDPMVALRHD